MSSNKSEALQEPFLNALRLQEVSISIYLVNGIRLQGKIKSFDQYVLLLENTVVQMVYKHAISTIVPGRNVEIPPVPEKNPTEKVTGEKLTELTAEVRKHGLNLLGKHSP